MNYDEIILFLEYNIHPSSRTIYLGPKLKQPDDDDTSYLMAETAIKNIHLLNQESKDWITLVMNNSGGDVRQGSAIIDAILTSKSPIRIICYGNCLSMGTSILQVANERILSKNCTLMIHKSSYEENISRKKAAQNWKKYEKSMDQKDTDTLLGRIRQKHPKYKLKTLEKLLQHDTIFTAQEAVDLGLADKILEK